MYQLSALELREKFLKKKTSAMEITRYFLDRIHKLNPQIKAFISILEERAFAKAKTLDENIEKNKYLGKLAGIPIIIKDNMHIKGEITTCASKFLTNYKALFDSTAIRLLEEEGAILIGKSNMDEFAMGSSTERSGLFPTYNPWNLSCVPGGSSGGSAAAIAARLSPLATGSDTGGSIRQPASMCGVVGFKPTYGRVSRFGLVAFGSSLDQIGCFGTNAKDLGLMMEVMGRHCTKDSTSLNLPGENYLDNLPESLKGTTVGVPWHFLEGLDNEVYDNFKASVDILKELGAKVVDINLDIMKYCIGVYYILATAEASTNLARFDGIRYGIRSASAKTLDEIYDISRDEGFGAEVKKRIMLGTYVLSSGFQDAYYKKAQKIRTLMIRACDEAFEKCDIIAMPVSPSSAFEIGAIQDPLEMYLQDLFTIPASLAGLPCISFPSGFENKNKPLGFQLIGPQMHDVSVIAKAHAFEKASAYTKKIPPLFDKEHYE